MKVLITGASGLLGSKLSELAAERKHEVYSAYLEHEPPHGIPIRLDMCDREAVEKVLEEMKPEAIVHAAALTDVDRCEREHELAWKINVEGTENLAKSSGERIFLIYVSTDYVFDGDRGMYEETDETRPVNHYGFTKLEGEQRVKSLTDRYCIVRTSVLFGSTPVAGKTNFVLWLINRLKMREATGVAVDLWSSPTLNSNLALMTLEILERRLTGTFHLAGATRVSRYEFADLIAEDFDLDTNLVAKVPAADLPWIAKRPMDSSLSVEKACRTLRSKPLEIREALRTMRKELEERQNSGQSA